jgi:hypothetical protein
MFSVRTRRRIVTTLIVLVYAGILAFVPLVLWPAMQENSKQIETLQTGRTELDEWTKRIESGEFKATAGRVAARSRHLEEVRQTYDQLKQYCMERDRILERTDLLGRTNQYNFKQDYLSLLNHWREMNAVERTDRTEGKPEELAVTPAYGWAEEEGVLPPRADYDNITKQTAVLDTVVRMFSTGEADVRLTNVALGKPREADSEPAGPGYKQFGAVRYKLWPATVTGLVPFSSALRPSLEQVVTSPLHTVEAPVKVDRDKAEPRYLPTFEERFRLPCVRIRAVRFSPAALNWVKVTVELDIYDFSAQEARQ